MAGPRGTVGALFVANRVLGAVRSALGGALGRRLDEHLRERVMRALNRPIGIAHLEDPDLRDTIERAQDVGGGGFTAGGTVNPLANTAVRWLQSVGSAVILARFNVPLAVGWFCASVAAHVLGAEFLRSTKVGTNQAKFVRRELGAGQLRAGLWHRHRAGGARSGARHHPGRGVVHLSGHSARRLA